MMFDTSVWIDFLVHKQTKQTLLLNDEIRNRYQFHICSPIAQGILQGIRNDRQFGQVKELLSQLVLLRADAWMSSVGAAEMYRNLRKKGITIRKPQDCLIAWYAIEFDLQLVHNDRDFDLIAAYTPLKVLSL